MGCNKSQHQFIHTCAFVMWVACVVAISTFFVCFFAKTAVVKLVSMQSQHCDADAFNKNTKKKMQKWNKIQYMYGYVLVLHKFYFAISYCSFTSNKHFLHGFSMFQWNTGCDLYKYHQTTLFKRKVHVRQISRHMILSILWCTQWQSPVSSK